MLSSIRKSCFLLFIILEIGLIGCGDSGVSQGEATSDKTEMNSSAGGNGSSGPTDSNLPKTEKEELSGQRAEVGDAAAFSSETEGDQPDGTLNQSSPATAPPFPSTAPPVPTPSEQQLAKWKLQDFEPLKLMASVKYDQMGFTQRIVSLPQSREFLLGGSSITLWTAGSEQPDHVFADWRENENLNLLDLAVAPSGKWFAATNSSGELISFDLQQRKELASKKVGQSLLPSITISTDSRSIATASFGGEITIWDANELAEQKAFEIDSRGIKSLRFISADHLLIAAESMSVWDVKSGSKIKDLEGDRYYESLSLSPSGEFFTYGTAKGLKVCKVSDYDVMVFLSCNLGLDELVVWKDERTLASVSANLIRIWDVPSSRIFQAIDNRGSELAGACWLNSNVLAIASLLRTTRFWSTVDSAAELGWKPLQPEISPPEVPAKAPSSGLQFANAIDLRSFPRLPDAVPQLEMDFMVQYTTAVDTAEAMLFCRYALHQAGWGETEASSPTSGYMSFQKHGFQLDCSVTELPNQGSTVSMTSLGNFHLDMVPELSELAESAYKSSRTSMYSSKSDFLTLEVAILKAMTERGWIAYSRLSSSHSEHPDRRDLSFLKNSTELRVSISKHNSDPTALNLQYTPFPVVNSIAIPDGCTYVEFNGSPELQLVACTRQTQDNIKAFFDKSMQADGWQVVKPLGASNSDQSWLLYTRDQQDITIGLQAGEDGWTLITVGQVSSSGSFQLAATVDESEAPAALSGIEVADFPLVENAQEVQYQKQEKTLTFHIPKITLDQFMKMYEGKLAEIGWTKDGRAMVEKEFCYADFAKDGVTITLRGNLRDDKATCSVEGDGLLWTKPLPGLSAIVSFETWLRNNQKVASLEFLGQYESEMRALQSAVGGN